MGRGLVHAWTDTQFRQRELGKLLNGDVWVIGRGRLRSAQLAPVRWSVNSVALAIHLLRHDPEWVLVTNPPIWPSLVVSIWSGLRRKAFILDSHPGGFGLQGDRVGARVQVLHRLLARRAEVVLVTTPLLRDLVHGWGARALVFYEAPLEWDVGALHLDDIASNVLYIGNFMPDEPVNIVYEAASAPRTWRLEVTGDVRKMSRLDHAHAHAVEFTGWLDQHAYIEKLAGAHVVVVLTDDNASVMRAAIEATHAGRPLIVSDTPATRAAFPHAIHIQNTGDELRIAISDTISNWAASIARANIAKTDADRRSVAQSAQLQRIVAASQT